ncbi:PH domain-containing protein [Rubripirellula reticaptiva]|uniref:Bacterial membrane flanked domain protein n=1 Tax=Rubripirellula reticaptiva TaxID=2528013 RepID=A0A5C6F9M1_9BACT|nr:PH domain-containing protein [Rubripirellula reticaptiva]TWU58115.1 Bacterial membrane flanked domain protein [Rubripirellula reticaptiva]
MNDGAERSQTAQDDENGRFDPLSPNHLKLSRLIGGSLTALVAIIAIGMLAIWYLINPALDLPFAVAAIAALFGVSFVFWFGWIFPSMSYRRAGWRLSEIGLEIRRGVWWRHRIVVPHSRIQHSDIEQGPLQRRFDLSTLVVHTAGTKNSSVSLEGIRHETAQRLREALVTNRLARVSKTKARPNV